MKVKTLAKTLAKMDPESKVVVAVCGDIGHIRNLDIEGTVVSGRGALELIVYEI